VASDAMKGGLRYKKLKRLVTEQLADEGLEAFFIGTAQEIKAESRAGHVSYVVLRHLAAKEHVLAVTRSAVHIIEMDGMGVFSAKLGGEVANVPLGDIDASLEGKVVTIAGQTFHVFPFHDEDAAAFVAAVSAASKPPPPPPPPPPGA
jgi:hypothetical protein